MNIDHHTAATNLHALATALNALASDATVGTTGDETRKAVLEAIKANAETLKEQTA